MIFPGYQKNVIRIIKKMNFLKCGAVRRLPKKAGRLKKIREALKLRQKEIAQRLNISSPSYSELESGKYKPNFELISNLSREFNVNLYYLIFGEGDMFLGPVQLFSRKLGKNVVNKVQIERFLHYLAHSPMA